HRTAQLMCQHITGKRRELILPIHLELSEHSAYVLYHTHVPRKLDFSTASIRRACQSDETGEAAAYPSRRCGVGVRHRSDESKPRLAEQHEKVEPDIGELHAQTPPGQ